MCDQQDSDPQIQPQIDSPEPNSSETTMLTDQDALRSEYQYYDVFETPWP